MLYLLGINLRFTSETHFPFLHGGVAHGAILSALGNHGLPPGWFPLFPESGRTIYPEGALYRLGLVISGRPEGLESLVDGFERLGQDQRLTGEHSLGGNFIVEGVTDLLVGQALTGDLQPRLLDCDQLQKASDRLAGQTSVSLRVISPLRLMRHHHTQVKQHAYCDGELFEADRLLSNLIVRARDWAPDYLPMQAIDKQSLSAVRAEVLHLTWVDMPLHRKKEATGGVLGEVALNFLDEVGTAAVYLLLGQYLGAGKDINYGFGHFRLIPEPDLPRLPRRAETLARAAADLPGRESTIPLEFEEEDEDEEVWSGEDESLGVVAGLADGSHQPSPYLGRVIVGSSGRPRALAIPDPEDQALQGRVHRLLAPAVDELLETSSFAYRQGLSRHGAAQSLQKAYKQGLSWILRADVRAFYDSVNWTILRHKLTALWDDDPLVDLIMRWVMAPVRFSGQLIHRDRGLPQGAVLSPLLSNLFLDQFDDQVMASGFKLIRYADDFVICCRSREEAEAARQQVVAALKELELELNDDKASLSNFEAGFSFLGFAFVRSLVVQRRKEAKSKGWIKEVDEASPEFWREAVTKAPAGAWLSGLDLDALPDTAAETVRRTKGFVSRQARAQGRAPVYLANPDIKVRTSQGRLLLSGDEGSELVEIPLALVESVICFGPVNLSGPVLRACLRHQVPVHLCTMAGDLVGQLQLPGDMAAASIIQAQTALVNDEKRCLAVARELVSAKIANCRMVLQRQTHRDRMDEQVLDQLQEAQVQAERQESIDALRGLEGRAAWLYFDRWSAHIPEEFGFNRRSRRPALDPINAMLNFGYTLLYRQIAALICLERLHPGLGIYHQPSDRFHALAADLQEEFRHLVDLMILRLVHLDQVVPADFDWHEKQIQGCLLGNSVRRAFVILWQQRLEETITTQEEGPWMTYRELMHRQVKKIKAVIQDPTQNAYQAYRGK